jgi:hypothetical protein
MIYNFTIRDAFGADKIYDVIYVIKSPGFSPGVGSQCVEYVGMAGAQCVSDRIARHIGDYFVKPNPSKLSKLLRDNHPNYFYWEVHIFDIPTAETLTGRKYGCLPCTERGLYDYFDTLQGHPPRGNAMRPGNMCKCPR